MQVASIPDDHDIDDAQEQAPRGPEHHLAAAGKELFAQHGVPSLQIIQQLAQFAPERSDDANPRKRLADPAIDLLCVLADRTIDGPDAPREDQAHQHDAGNDRESGQRQPPVECEQHDDRYDQADEREGGRHDRHLQQSGRRIHVTGEARQDAARLHVPQLWQWQMQEPLK